MDYDTYHEYYRTYERISNMTMGSERTKLRDQMIDMLRVTYGPNDERANDLIYYLKRIW